VTLPETPHLKEEQATVERAVRDEIKRLGVSREDLATRLGLLPVGVDVLLATTDWTLDTACRVAESVGMKINVSVDRCA